MITDKVAFWIIVILNILGAAGNLTVILLGEADFWNLFFVVVNVAFVVYMIRKYA